MKIYPGDNLMMHKALDVVKRCDVVVDDGAKGAEEVLHGLTAHDVKTHKYGAAVERRTLVNELVEAALADDGYVVEW